MTRSQLFRKILFVLDRLGSSPCARIDARVWATRFRKREAGRLASLKQAQAERLSFRLSRKGEDE